MDIFTTQLTRVVPVPIKPATLKVKALLKDAGTGRLTEDPDHLENHELYFSRVNEKPTSDSEQQAQQKQQLTKYQSSAIKKNSLEVKEGELVDDEEKRKPISHLDIYI